MPLRNEFEIANKIKESDSLCKLNIGLNELTKRFLGTVALALGYLEIANSDKMNVN